MTMTSKSERNKEATMDAASGATTAATGTRRYNKQYTCPVCQKPLRCPSCDGRRGGAAGDRSAKSRSAITRWQAFHALLMAATSKGGAK